MGLDKFYTKEKIAKECVELIPEINSYDFIIEPSAGSGTFSHLINCIAYDIEPDCNSIIKSDWLTTYPQVTGKVLVFGNPPFGSRSILAKKFIKHSIEIGATTIAFILPDTFSKLANQKVFPKQWRLIVEHKLTDSTFILEGKNYIVPCTFYIWTKEPGNYNLRKKKINLSEDFIFLPRNSKNADFVINGNSGKIKPVNEVTNSKSEHYIKSKNKTKDELIKIFSEIEFPKMSSVNGGNYWISQQEILEKYQEYTGEENS